MVVMIFNKMEGYYVCSIEGCECLLERGHSTIEGLGALQFYSDGARVPYAACGTCGLGNTLEDHDGCIGTLTGNVMNACCGHGETFMAYVQFWDRSRIDGQEAIDYMERHSSLKNNS